MARDRAALDRYLGALERASPDSAPGSFPTRSDELAYWINAYNAMTVRGVLERGAAMSEFLAEERNVFVDRRSAP